jgi:hypothetical protein
MSKDNRKRRRELGLLPEPDVCVARSKRTGAACKNAPVAGSVVCRMHGGAAPQVLAKARERLALAADDAVSTLIRLMTDPKVSASDRRQAATALLDRAGISSKAELDVTIAPWIGVLEGVVAQVDDAEVARQHDYSGREAASAAVTGQATTPRTIEVGPSGEVVPVPFAPQPADPNVPQEVWVNGDDSEPRPHVRAARIVRE